VVRAAEPRHARSRRPGSHLAVDAVEAIVLGCDGVGTFDDAVAAACVLRDGLEAGGEVPQGRRLLDDPVPAQLTGA
jgi:Asp/Glu/hydantoin racemase